MPYPSAFAAYLEQTPPDQWKIVPVLDLFFAGGVGQGRLSTVDLTTDVGFYEGRIQDVQDPTFGIDPKSASLTVAESTVTIIDGPEEASPNFRKYEKILEGATKQRGIRALLRWASPDLDPNDWYVLFDAIFDRAKYHSSGLIDLIIRTDDRWVRSGAFKRPILKSEWPNAPDTSLDIYLPLVVGTHLSTSLSARGFIPTILVQTEVVEASQRRWDFVSLGYVTVTAVYRIRNNVATQMVLTSDYTILKIVVAGKACTIIQWNLSEDILTTDTIQCDVQGITDLGDGTGTLLTNPVTQIRFWLVNFAHGAWLAGSWLSEGGSPIEPTSWAEAEAYAQKYQLEGSFRVGGTVDQRTIIEVFNEWLATWLMFRTYWTPDGKLAMAVRDCTFPQYGTGSFFDLIRERDCLSRPEFSDDPQALVRRFSAAHLFDVAGNKSWGSMDVQDLNVEEDVTQTVRMTDSVSKF